VAIVNELFAQGSFALAIGALGFVTLAAASIPARRASRLEPTIALRE